MGGRLSTPRGPDGLNKTSKSTSSSMPARMTRSSGIINGRTVMAPLAALTMACLLFVYARTSIRAAKLHAQKTREADGGQISWHKESMRRHGQLGKVDSDRNTLKEALQADLWQKKDAVVQAEAKVGAERSTEEQQLRKMMGKKD